MRRLGGGGRPKAAGILVHPVRLRRPREDNKGRHSRAGDHHLRHPGRLDPSTSVRQQDDQGETDGVAGSEEQPDTGRVSERLLAACGDELFRKFVLLPLEARVVQQCRDPRRRARFTQSS